MSQQFERMGQKWRAIVRTHRATFCGDWRSSPHAALRSAQAKMLEGVR